MAGELFVCPTDKTGILYTGSSLLGYLAISWSELYEAFGDPFMEDGQREWRLRLPSGQLVSIYQWHSDPAPHVGGFNKDAFYELRSLLNV